VIAELTSLALMVAALLFVVSLPLGDGDAGKALRRAAAFAFVMAFVPATLVCLASPLFRPPHSTGRMIEFLLAAFGAIGLLVVLSLAAYGFLNVRGRGGSPPAAHADRYKHAKRRSTEHEREERHDRDAEWP
jgi:hypothetical protein